MQLILMFRLIFVTTIILVLGACGGGGNNAKTSASSSSTGSNPVVPVAQTFTFAQVGPVNLLVGDQLTNVTSGQGTGNVTYSSNNTAVATVSNVGAIAVVGSGDAIITATKAVDDKYLAATANFTIHAVGINQTLAFTQTGTINLHVGDTLNNVAVGEGTGAITYVSNNTAVATVDANGLVNVISLGNAIISANKAADSRYLSAISSYTINATRIAQTFDFTQVGSVNLLADQTYTNKAVGQGIGSVSYSSNNPSVAMVDNQGFVTILNSGIAVITAIKDADMKYLSATASYTINAARINQTINFNQTGPLNTHVGDIFLNKIISQSTGSVTYSSSNTAVASVNNAGEVTILSAGTAIITANVAADAKYSSAETSYSINATLANQFITFVQQGPINLLLGNTLTNQANGQGTGAIIYSSSDANVATVDDFGVVTVIGFGTTEITATKAADTRYASASAIYKINVGITMTGWIGSQNTLISFPVSMNGFEFYRSSENNCNFLNYSSCVDGQMDIINGTAITDTAKTLIKPGYYALKKNNSWAAFTANLTDVTSGRSGYSVVAFHNKLWIIGGKTNATTNEIWSSDDGIIWTLQTSQAAFSIRTNANVVVYKNQLWLVGGGIYEPTNDVWSSADGITWIQQTASARFPTRDGSQLVVHDNLLWLIAGDNYSDVWSSSDGINWTLKTDNAAFLARSTHKVVSFNNKLWLIGGWRYMNGALVMNDVWSSVDGITWIKEIDHAAFSPRTQSQVVAYNNKLWLIGGLENNDIPLKNDIWSSDDGITWTQQVASAAFAARGNHKVEVFNNQLFMLGGNTDNSLTSSGIWSSVDGIEWRKGFSGTFQLQQ